MPDLNLRFKSGFFYLTPRIPAQMRINYLYTMENLENRIFSLKNKRDFESLAMDIFHYQSTENRIYAKYLEFLRIKSSQVNTIYQIPFMPISFFRDHLILTGNRKAKIVFESSGTTGHLSSKHHIVSPELYVKSFLTAFSNQYGNPGDFCIVALLPSYLERNNSSLVYMMNHLIGLSNHPDSGFYLNNLDELSKVLKKRVNDKHATLLLGVSFALLDLASVYPQPLSENITVMETGGMKGRRKEMIREELHDRLKSSFNLKEVHSEYGMTELLSQAYAGADGKFIPPPWMSVIVRDIYDPLSIMPAGLSGGLNIIDLANIHSCSFLATDDLGKVYENGTFEVTGRLDQSDIRGCNLMVL